MNKIAVVFWSGTGNTEQMAAYVKEGAAESGAQVSLYQSSVFRLEMVDDFDAIAFGCPSMGAEVLEESEFQPMWDTIEEKLKDKKIGLFGSYGWGDGEWMRNWEEQCGAVGAVLAANTVICNETPDEEAVLACKALGKAIAL